MLSVVWLSQFKKDFKLITKRKKRLEKLQLVLNELQSHRSLPVKYRNHRLKGKYINCLECHIEPDWLLIYRLTPEKLVLVRTGSHSDLF